MAPPLSTDHYISAFTPEVQAQLQALRNTIKITAPDAEEVISYSMPAFKYKGKMLVYFAAHTKHIGFYPMASAIAKFQDELSVYKGARGSVQFPFNQPLPLALITRMIKFRMLENLQKAEAKKKK